MNKQKISSPGYTQQGVVLLEVMIAILIFSMGVLAVIGLQAAMIKNTAESKFRADAGYLAQQRLGQMWSDPDNVLAYLEDAPGTDISALLPGGTRTVSRPDPVNFPNQFLITITWQQPGEAPHSFTTTASITGG